VRWAQDLLQQEIRSHTQSSCELQRILPPPSRLGSGNFQEQQINHLLDDSLVPQRSKPWCNALDALNLTKDATTKQCERERSGRALQGSMNLSKCQEGASQPGHGVFILPLPVTTRYVKNAYLTDCLRLNSNDKNTKSAAIRVACCTGWTVRKDFANCPRVGCGSSAQTSWAAHGSVWFDVNFGPSALDPWIAARKRFFSKNFAKNLRYKIKLKVPTDRPPKGPDCPP
jgi:hypothetical protein